MLFTIMVTAQHIARTGQLNATIRSVEALSPRMRRLTLTASAIADLEWPLGCDIAIVLRSEGDGREVRRRYTVRSVDGELLVLDAVLHGHGPGSAWATTAGPGDGVTFFGPRGSVDLTDASPVLAMTDESGLPAIACVAEKLSQPMLVLAEVHDEADQYPLPDNCKTSWVLRGDRPAGQTGLLLAALDELTSGEAPAFAYVLGESRAIVALRDELARFGLNRTETYAKGYWNLNARPTR